MRPLVSVCVLSMNHEKFVVQCLESILLQDYPNLEIVFLDNNSADRTFETAKEYLEKQNKIPFKSFKREKNFLTSSNFNYLVSHATADFICFISADDWLKPENVSRKMDRMLSDKDIGYVFSEAFFFFEDTGKIVPRKCNVRDLEGYIFNELIKFDFVTAPGSVIDVKKLREIGGFKENMIIEDWSMLLELSQKYKIAYIDECLVYYRQHSSNTSKDTDVRFLKSRLEVIKSYKWHPDYKEIHENIAQLIVYNAVGKEPFFSSLKLILKYFRFKRFYFKQLVKLFLNPGSRQPAVS